MSRVEDALKRLKSRAGSPTPIAGDQSSRGNAPRLSVTPVPQGLKKKVEIDGEKHGVSQDELIHGGLLASPNQAVPIADEFRRIKRPLIVNAAKDNSTDSHANVIMVASALPGAGKTFCSVNLAASMSMERELNVLLVDADVAKPHISQAFGLGDAPGLIDMLVDETLDLGDVLVRTDLNDIQVLPAGRRHPQATELLASDRMSKIVAELAQRYSDRLIILDSPPLLITTEAQALAAQVGQILLIVEAGRTTQQVLEQTLDVLDRDKAINLILNKSKHLGLGGYGGEYGYYGYRQG